MIWVQVEENVPFNLEQVTHFEIIGRDEKAELRACLNIGYPKDDKLARQARITVARGTKAVCEAWRKDTITCKHNLPCKGHLYPIREHLNTIGAELRKITASIEGYLKSNSVPHKVTHLSPTVQVVAASIAEKHHRFHA